MVKKPRTLAEVEAMVKAARRQRVAATQHQVAPSRAKELTDVDARKQGRVKPLPKDPSVAKRFTYIFGNGQKVVIEAESEAKANAQARARAEIAGTSVSLENASRDRQDARGTNPEGKKGITLAEAEVRAKAQGKRVKSQQAGPGSPGIPAGMYRDQAGRLREQARVSNLESEQHRIDAERRTSRRQGGKKGFEARGGVDQPGVRAVDLSNLVPKGPFTPSGRVTREGIGGQSVDAIDNGPGAGVGGGTRPLAGGKAPIQPKGTKSAKRNTGREHGPLLPGQDRVFVKDAAGRGGDRWRLQRRDPRTGRWI